MATPVEMTILFGNAKHRFQATLSRPERSGVERSAVFLYSSLNLATVDYPGLHHEGDVLEYADVVEGIAGHGDDVGIVAGLERA
jgi:hypothetical protein